MLDEFPFGTLYIRIPIGTWLEQREAARDDGPLLQISAIWNQYRKIRREGRESRERGETEWGERLKSVWFSWEVSILPILPMTLAERYLNSRFQHLIL